MNTEKKEAMLDEIIDVFESLLDDYGINLPNDEKEGEDDPANIFGTDYEESVHKIEVILREHGLLKDDDEDDEDDEDDDDDEEDDEDDGDDEDGDDGDEDDEEGDVEWGDDDDEFVSRECLWSCIIDPVYKLAEEAFTYYSDTLLNSDRFKNDIVDYLYRTSDWQTESTVHDEDVREAFEHTILVWMGLLEKE